MRNQIDKLRKLAAWAEKHGLNDDEIVDIGTQLDANLTAQAVARIWPERLDDAPRCISEGDRRHIVFEADGFRVCCIVTGEELAALREALSPEAPEPEEVEIG